MLPSPATSSQGKSSRLGEVLRRRKDNVSVIFNIFFFCSALCRFFWYHQSILWVVRHLSFLLTFDPLWQSKEMLLRCLSPLPLWSASSWSSLMHRFPLHQVSRESFNTSKRSKMTNLTMCFCFQKRAHPQFVKRSFPHLWVEERNSHGLFGPCSPYSQLLPVSVICFRTVHRVWCHPVCKIIGELNAIKENVCLLKTLFFFIFNKLWNNHFINLALNPTHQQVENYSNVCHVPSLKKYCMWQ